MQKFPRFCLLLIALTLVVGCVPATLPSRPRAIALHDCQLSAPGMTTRRAAQCGTLTVFQDRSARSGRQIDLRIAVLPATSAAWRARLRVGYNDAIESRAKGE